MQCLAHLSETCQYVAGLKLPVQDDIMNLPPHADEAGYAMLRTPFCNMQCVAGLTLPVQDDIMSLPPRADEAGYAMVAHLSETCQYVAGFKLPVQDDILNLPPQADEAWYAMLCTPFCNMPVRCRLHVACGG